MLNRLVVEAAVTKNPAASWRDGPSEVGAENSVCLIFRSDQESPGRSQVFSMCSSDQESPGRSQVFSICSGTDFDVVLCFLFGTRSVASTAFYHSKNSHRLVISAVLDTSSVTSMQE